VQGTAHFLRTSCEEHRDLKIRAVLEMVVTVGATSVFPTHQMMAILRLRRS